MIDLLKKTLLAGVGLTLMTKDKVEELAREVASNAQMSAEKGQQFVDEAVARAHRGREELEGLIQRGVNETLRRANVPTRAEFDALRAELETLRTRLEAHSAHA